MVTRELDLRQIVRLLSHLTGPGRCEAEYKIAVVTRELDLRQIVILLSHLTLRTNGINHVYIYLSILFKIVFKRDTKKLPKAEQSRYIFALKELRVLPRLLPESLDLWEPFHTHKKCCQKKLTYLCFKPSYWPNASQSP